jgi:hypothetical protein
MVVKLLVASRVPAPAAPWPGDDPNAPALYRRMAAKGICKIKNGWVHQDSVWVRYDDGKKLEIPASQYAEQGFQPPIAQLPECKGARQDA